MIINTKPIINQKSQLFLSPAPAADWGQLQHPGTLMGLSRRRFRRDDVLRLIDTGQIRWAWDISRKGARRPEVRIWRESLLAYLARESGGDPKAFGADDLSLPQVIEAILPRPPALTPRAATVRGRELQRRLLCCRTHLARLIADGELCCVGPTGPGRNPAILYQSVFEFLKRRSMSL
jgi:hypothetical protein